MTNTDLYTENGSRETDKDEFSELVVGFLDLAL